ncbi:MAG: zinc ABC transporter substrate-binding protein [Candidatus Thorarchaeota archaeon]|nr:zinc ABC transporter substrate-binding protein [Candidatus Thorarchaeota archaeon]
MKWHKTVLLILISSLAFIPLSPPFVVHAQTESRLMLAVSIAPLGGIVDGVGGNFIETTILLTEAVEPHAYTVDPSIVAIADSADLLVLTGHYDWEEELADLTATPYITLDDEGALMSYEDFGARLSPMPGTHVDELVLVQNEHDDRNPHAYWLLPENAIAIANATRAALSSLDSALASNWNDNFNGFVDDVESLSHLVEEADSEYRFSEMHAVVVFPAEAYVAEAFGIEVEAVLIVESQTITGDELLQVQNALRNGTIELILGSDVARFQAGGEFAEQLIKDYGGKLVWWRAVFFSGLSDYISIMTYNLGSLTATLELDDEAGQSNVLDLSLIALAIVLGTLVAIETVVLIARARAE